ncbi:MAG: PQQ-dependent sugar dehydrogenase [Actinomycetota bacterium]
MRGAVVAVLAVVVLSAAACDRDETGARSNGVLQLTPVADVAAPSALAVRAGDSTLYVAEQDGQVLAVRDGVTDPKPVLDIIGRVTVDRREQGLLGLAFSPDGSKLYVHYTDRTNDGAVQIDEYGMDGNIADRSSRRSVLSVEKPQPNHNGGQLAFGPDGLLYIGLGDGGGQADRSRGHPPGGNGQSLDTLLGKVLRIDPTASGDDAYAVPSDNPFAAGGGRPEIWAYGLRNPWRFSFDRETGDLWIGDVGQSAWEEIDYMPAGSGAGANYGWARLEGSRPFDGEAPPDAVPPIFEYPNPDDGCAVIGGFVYRGTRIPSLVGAYLFSDFCEGQLRVLRRESGDVAVERLFELSAANVAAFGQDNDGEIFVLSQGDGLLRLDPA